MWPDNGEESSLMKESCVWEIRKNGLTGSQRE